MRKSRGATDNLQIKREPKKNCGSLLIYKEKGEFPETKSYFCFSKGEI